MAAEVESRMGLKRGRRKWAVDEHAVNCKTSQRAVSVPSP